MAGLIFAKEGQVVILESGGAALSNNNQINAGVNLDVRQSGNGAEMFRATFELNTAFGAVPSSGSQANLYLAPALDGTNFITVNTTDHIMPNTCFRGSFVTTASGAYRMTVEAVPLEPLLYKPYVDNQTGQQMTSGWTLKVVASEDQYT